MTTLRLRPELEEALRRIPGVRAASVVTMHDATPTEVHILADRAKAPKQLVRDIQSLALASYDLDLDHRIVSVVQLDDEDVAVEPDTESSVRALVASVMTQTAGSDATVSVTIRTGGDEYTGTASGATSAGVRARLVARATLDALGELLGTPAEVEQSSVLPVGGRLVAVSVIHLTTRQGELVLSGSAIVRNDEADAVARSVLDAVNRRLAG
ncbi:MAG: hypothetical protein QOK14_216 [Frankiaceae bacterium]|jgi:hypothetical protein|nr:hypothetical protein [Frankiaceae bacterium]